MSVHHIILVITQRNPPPPVIALSDARSLAPSNARVEPHITQWLVVHPSPDATIEAHYVFDDVYAAAHPESLDTAHLAMLHALLTAKLLDDGDVIATAAMLDGSCRWPTVGRPRRSLVTA